LFVVITSTGCSYYSAADPARGTHEKAVEHIEADKWPARETDMLDQLNAMTPKQVTIVFPIGPPKEKDGPPQEEKLHVKVMHSGVYGKGIVRELVPVESERERLEDMPRIAREWFPGLQFVSFPQGSGPPSAYVSRLKEDQPDRFRRFMMRR